MAKKQMEPSNNTKEYRLYVAETVGYIKGKIDEMHDNINNVEDEVRKINGRLRTAEGKIKFIYGGATMLGIIISSYKLITWII